MLSFRTLGLQAEEHVSPLSLTKVGPAFPAPIPATGGSCDGDLAPQTHSTDNATPAPADRFPALSATCPVARKPRVGRPNCPRGWCARQAECGFEDRCMEIVAVLPCRRACPTPDACVADGCAMERRLMRA